MVDIEKDEIKTVGQFIEELKQYPEDAIVFIRVTNYHGETDHFDYSPGTAYNKYTKEVQIIKK